jgi:UDP-glucose 4-epimerase
VRIVITGASGNVDTALLPRLTGDHELIGVCRRPPEGGAPYDTVDWHALDLATPAQGRRRAHRARPARPHPLRLLP